MRGAATLLRRAAVGTRKRCYATQDGAAECARPLAHSRSSRAATRSGRPGSRRRGREAGLRDGGRCAADRGVARPQHRSRLTPAACCSGGLVAASAGAIAVFGLGVLGVMGAAKGAASLLGARTQRTCSASIAPLSATRQATRWTPSAPGQPQRRRRRRAFCELQASRAADAACGSADGCGAARGADRAARAAAKHGERRTQGCHQEAAARWLTKHARSCARRVVLATRSIDIATAARGLCATPRAFTSPGSWSIPPRRRACRPRMPRPSS